jgi:hypothetical protein
MNMTFEFNNEFILPPEEQELYEKLDSLYREISNRFINIKIFGIFDNLQEAMNSYSTTLKYEIHRIKSYKKADIKYYEISSVTDFNSNSFDRKIDGKRVKVLNALTLLNNLKNVSSTEELQTLRPLLLARNAGYKKTIFPPFYLGCRAVTVMSYKQD